MITNNCEKVDVDEQERKRSRHMWMFVFNICAVSTGHMVNAVYTNGVIRTIERRFGLSSSKTGLLSSCNDILQICLVIFIGYFGQKYNKPKIICVTIMFSALAGFMMASPHFLFSNYDDTYGQRKHPESSDLALLKQEHFTKESLYSAKIVPETTFPSAQSNPIKRTVKYGPAQYCSAKDNDTLSRNDSCKNVEEGQVHPAYYVFVVAQLVLGIGSSGAFTLSMAYIDENAPKYKASVYIGVLMSLLSFGPASGFVLATLCLRLPENLTSGKIVDPADPSFIGCWWLGYLIDSVFIVVCAAPLWWYPINYSRSKVEAGANTKTTKNITIIEWLCQLKGIPRAFWSLLSNKLYIINACQIICSSYTIYGIFINLVRYIEIHFNRTAAVGSIIVGVVSAVAGAIGNVAGGALVSKFKFRAVDGIRLVLFSNFVFATGLLINLNLACPQVEMDMNYDQKLDMNITINDCNQPCLCTTNRIDYRPICASNNISYFSPCIAGCSESINDTYVNCKCLKKPVSGNGTLFFEYINGAARNGYCIPPCNLLIPFAITLFIMCFCGSVSRIPATMISLRIVKDEERSFALGVNSFLINLFGFIPAPLLFGYLVDKSCTLWQMSCMAVGACLMFDVARLRHFLFGSSLFIELINFSLNFIIFMLLRKMPLGSSLLSRKKNLVEEVENMEIKCEPIEEKTENMEMKIANEVLQLTKL